MVKCLNVISMEYTFMFKYAVYSYIVKVVIVSYDLDTTLFPQKKLLGLTKNVGAKKNMSGQKNNVFFTLPKYNMIDSIIHILCIYRGARL